MGRATQGTGRGCIGSMDSSCISQVEVTIHVLRVGAEHEGKEQVKGLLIYKHLWASLVAQMVKESACSVGHLGSIPGLGRSPGEGNGNPLQYSCLENPMDGGAL